MTLVLIGSLFVSMVVLALIPGPGVLAVVARSSVLGFQHGVSTTVGIVAADFIFVTLALLGLTALSELLGTFFVIVKYIGALYLVWLGISLILSKPSPNKTEKVKTSTHLASFTTGLVITLSNPKAILFYVSFFPAFLDLSQVTLGDAFVIYVITAIAIGGVMLAYAFLADRARAASQSSDNYYLRYGAGAILVGSGAYVAART